MGTGTSRNMWAPTNPGWFTMTVLLAAEIYVNVNVISINTVGGGKLKFVGFFFCRFRGLYVS